MATSLISSNSLISAFHAIGLGGPIVVALLAMSVAALTVIILKTAQFIVAGVGRNNRTISSAVDAWRAGRQSDAINRIAKNTDIKSRLVLSAMQAYSDQRTEALVREDIESQALAHLSSLRSYLRVLEAAAQLAPLIGLFGTVLGMMAAFQTLQSAGTDADPTALAGGIWTALITTAIGLAVAIPAGLALYWFEGRLSREQALIEHAVTRILTAPHHFEQPTSRSRIELSDAAE